MKTTCFRTRVIAPAAVALAAILAAWAAAPSVAQDAPPAAQAPAEKVVCEFPALIVDVGQGNNAKLLNALMKRAGAPDDAYTLKELATPEDLEGVKTLVIGVGASTKGLGAAGLDSESEAARTKALLDAAKEAGIKVVGVHLGGIARRGEMSDMFNEQVLKGSTVFVVWEGGNEDGFFTRLAEQENIKLMSVEKKTDVGDALAKVFALGEEG